VGQLATIRDSFSRLRRRWRAWRARLRHARATAALFAILTLGLCEPLMCILHCQLWLPFAFQSYLASQQQQGHQHHQQHQHAAMAAEAPSGAAIQPAEAPAHLICQPNVGTRQGAVPFHVPPSPVHDMIPAGTLLLIVVLIASLAPAAPPGDPPRVAPVPLLRPPILFAR
jgi:hypothetical protein